MFLHFARVTCQSHTAAAAVTLLQLLKFSHCYISFFVHFLWCDARLKAAAAGVPQDPNSEQSDRRNKGSDSVTSPVCGGLLSHRWVLPTPP